MSDMSLRKLSMAGVMALAVSTFAPASASADWLFTPFLGGTFGGSANITDVGGDFHPMAVPRDCRLGGNRELRGA